MTSPPALRGVLLFHLNLSYSAIEVAERGEVVRRVYHPLFDLLERVPGLRLALEASGHTLERIEALDGTWLERLRAALDAGRVELVGSGDSQVIGPLVPASVNLWNQRLGRATYERLLGCAPRVALVNEMAWSQGVVSAYAAAGYEALVMEWNNPRRAHPEWEDVWRYRRVRTSAPDGAGVQVLWADAVAFQKFQRVVAGELDTDEYLAWVRAQAGDGDEARALFLYANDAEIFDFRPGRYRTEPALPAEGSEWERMARVLERLPDAGVQPSFPSELLDDPALDAGVDLVLNSASDPLPVKKQPKYNATRWALTGRDDLGLNTRCFERARRLEREGGTPEDWRALCRAWASDLRTHLTDERWSRAARDVSPAHFLEEAPAGASPRLGTTEVEHGPRRLRLRTDGVEVLLLPSRGLAVESLRFPEVHPEPLLGTLPHGHFEDIDWSADFYTAHTVLDLPARARVTDLAPVVPEVLVLEDRIVVRAEVKTELGAFPKELTLFRDHLELRYGLSALGERPVGVLRTGFLTLRPGGLGEHLSLCCENGGPPERFPLDGDVDHGASVSAFVSARSAVGATSGRLSLDDGHTALELSWPNWHVAALPLVTARRVAGDRFVRVAFSLAELDETAKPGAPLFDFQLQVSARRLAA